jgi:heme-degrading monooxygenase HmoA
MFTSIRKYKVIHGSAEELARRVREGFVPLIRQMPGFQSYYLLDGGPDVLITISRFDSADAAFASNEKAANWVRKHRLSQAGQISDQVAARMIVLQSRIAHEGARHDFTWRGQIFVEGGRIPHQSGGSVGGGIMKIRYYPGMSADDAEQTWTDNVAARLRGVADTALRPEDARARRSILGVGRSGKSARQGKHDGAKKRVSHA